MKRLRAFTLIELLIVVAIIGILAAIAVPNFLNARTRALIGRTMADVRALANGVAMYQIDANSPPFRRPGWPCGLCDEKQLDATYNVGPVTSPIAYMSSVPFDPFIDIPGVKPADDRGDGLPVGWYLYVAQRSDKPRDPYLGGWWIWGWGPDKTRQGYPIRPYDPTNGTLSSGDIIASDKTGFLREDISKLTGQGSANLESHRLPGM